MYLYARVTVNNTHTLVSGQMITISTLGPDNRTETITTEHVLFFNKSYFALSKAVRSNACYGLR